MRKITPQPLNQGFFNKLKLFCPKMLSVPVPQVKEKVTGCGPPDESGSGMAIYPHSAAPDSPFRKGGMTAVMPGWFPRRADYPRSAIQTAALEKMRAAVDL